jgi:hypothetical protein
LTGFALITPKELPPAGKLEAVDLVYGRLGKIPEEAWPRFSVTKSGPTTRPL